MHKFGPIAENSFSICGFQVCLPDMTFVHFRFDDSAELSLSTRHFVVDENDEIVNFEVA